MGVKFTHPEEEVIVVTGDGSIQMNIQELSTCLQYDIPVKIFNLNNRFLGMVKQWQDIIYQGRHSNSYMKSVPDFAAIAEAYGHVGMRISNPDELEEGIAKALAMKDRLVFVDITVDETEHVYPMQIKGEGMDGMWLSKTERT
jgi:acetolactate synthase-1/2/3 large subunit